MKEQAPAVEAVEAAPVVAPGVAPAAGGAVSQVLRLQATAGNVAVSRALAARRSLARQQAPPPARTAQQLADLNEDITQAIAEKETGRTAVESAMRTSAGVRASYASQVQATAGWTISALQALDDTRLAAFGLTRAELRDANARAVAAGAVWDAAMATAVGADAAAFMTAHATQIGAAGLLRADIDRMFLFRDLRADLENRLTTEVPARTTAVLAMAPADVWALATARERSRVGAPRVGQMTDARRNQLAPIIARREAIDAVAAGTPATTLGIPAGTINAYRPVGGGANYAEDKVAWQRVAVGREPPGGTVGSRIETAATADGGLQLGRARIARINEQFLAANPAATDDQVCDNAARAHNPGNPKITTVRGHFHTFHAARAAAAAAAAPAGAAAPAPTGAGPAGAAPAGPAGAAAPPGPTGALETGGDADTQVASAGPEPAGGESDAAGAESADGAAVADAGPAPTGGDLRRPAPLTEDEVLTQFGLEDTGEADPEQAVAQAATAPTPTDAGAPQPTLAAKRLARTANAPAPLSAAIPGTPAADAGPANAPSPLSAAIPGTPAADAGPTNAPSPLSAAIPGTPAADAGPTNAPSPLVAATPRTPSADVGTANAPSPLAAATPRTPSADAGLASAPSPLAVAIGRALADHADAGSLARVPSTPAAPVTHPAGGVPASATQDIANPAAQPARSAQTGGSQDEWYDDVVRNHLGLTPPEGVDPYDWLTGTFVTVQVFGVTSGPVLPRFATKLQRASARAEQMIRDRLTAAGTTVAGALTREQWNVGSVSGWDAGRRRGSHAFGQATDIDYFENPYVAHEAGTAEQAVDAQTGPGYDRAVMLFGDGQRVLSVVPNDAVGTGADRIQRPDRITNTPRPAAAGDAAGRERLYAQTMTVYNNLASDSSAMQRYFALVYPPPDLTSSTPTAATPHDVDAAAARALLPRIQALPPVAQARLFDGHVPDPLDEAGVAAALRPLIERDYERLGGAATNAGTPGDRPFATRGSAAQRAQRDPRRGFMTLPFEVVFSLRAEGLRWGACDLGGASGDIQHFDDGAAHVIPQRPA